MTSFTLDPALGRDTVKLAQWPLCEVLLMNDAAYPWVILVPRRPGVRELYDLAEADRQQWLLESMALGRWLMDHFEGDKLNVAALGNIVAQLHVHHIVRYRNDPAWPAPVWGRQPRQAYTADALAEIRNRLLPLSGMFRQV